MSKFYIGEPVIYVNNNRFELGIVKNRYELPIKYYWYDKEVSMFSYANNKLRLYNKDNKRAIVCLYLEYNLDKTDRAPITEDLSLLLLDNTDLFRIEQRYAYHIWYHTGDTAAYTDEENLYEISNSYAFTILRKQADDDIDAPSTCKEHALKIMSQFNLSPELYNKCLYWLTKRLENKNVNSLHLNSEYLQCGVRLELINILNERNLAYTEQDLTFILDIIFKHFSCNVLDMEVLEDAIKFYIERGGTTYAETTNS